MMTFFWPEMRVDLVHTWFFFFFFFTSITSHASLSEYAVLGYLLCTRSSGWKDGYDQDEYNPYRFL